MDLRRAALQKWINSLFEAEISGDLETVSGDASFRRYFRQRLHNGSIIAVDAPPEKENSEPFVRIARQWHQRGVKVPGIVQVDMEQGFMALEDFGDATLLPALTTETVDELYAQAISQLVHLQLQPAENLPHYDAALLDREMALFPEWFLGRHLGLTLTAHEQAVLDETFAMLRDTALGQPQVIVHRDYHSRNLMLLEGQLGIIDFQDAVVGPFTYDLVSLLKDCYIRWPQETVNTWAAQYFTKARAAGLIGAIADSQCQLWFDWMGLQRHIKVAGIFARLNYRDGKSAYLKDLPLTLQYIVEACEEYPALSAFAQLMKLRIMPAFEARA
jgi:N-acetylmuramate 1-kinase